MAHVILFVDDEAEVLLLLRKTFPHQEGYVALTAGSAEEALAILDKFEVDLLVTDQRMPGITGVELVAKARQRWPELAAILLTDSTDPKEALEAIQRGHVYRYLAKPWDNADLRQTVLRALEQVDLKRDRARLHAELERRFAALLAATDVARDVGVAESPLALVERLVERLPRIVPCDVVAALLVPQGSPPLLLIRPVTTLAEPALLLVKESVLSAWRERGQVVEEAALQVRVSGGGAGLAPPGAFVSRLTLPVQLEGAPAGLVVLESATPDAFGEGDARVLDVLVNELGASLRAFAAKVQGERHRLERVVESMADGLLVATLGSEEVIANPAARRMLGAPLARPLSVRWLKDALGFYPFDLVRGLDPGASGKAFVTEEVRLLDRTLSSIVSPVVEGDGRLSGVAVVLRDVTEQKRLEERKEEFVQVVSHELRTPLTAITGALDLLLGGLAGEVAAKQLRYLKMARDSTERLNALVDELLDLARLAKGKMSMEAEVTYLDELVRTTVERYQPAAAEKGQALTAELPRDPVRIVADPGRLGQVLSNLLTNAVKFTPDNGIIRVRLFTSPALEGVVGLSLWNNGDAIPEADLERIFEKFEQARTERTRRVRGTGLGLSISRGIIEAHGGSIWAESAPGQGVTFLAVLPLEPPEAPPAPEGRPAPTPPPQEPVPAVVVDDPDTAALVRGILRRRGLRAHAATTADEALAVARQVRPRLVVYDPRLPALAGMPVGDLLRHDGDTRDALLLAFTAAEAREAAFRAGAEGFVAKPADADALGEAAEGLVRRGRPSGTRVLVVDDDASIRAICLDVLTAHGYEVEQAATCAEARRLVRERRPELLLIDVELPDGDGFSLLETLQSERSSEPFGSVFLTARGEVADKTRGLKLGADDYLTKPFDAQELVARIDAVLRRREAALHASPMTRLPGNRAIEREVDRRLQAQVHFALSYLDLDNLKAFNDTYGYAKADGVVLQTARILSDVLAAHGGEDAFLGHVGGDDFVVLTTPERADKVCKEAIASFDRVIPLYYDRDDRERGYIEAKDRYGTRRRFPILSLSIATVIVNPGRFRQHADVARVAAELKQRAKRMPGSVHLVDDGAVA
jgi:signal transduction histidine kinase/DNA-binding response OmpR family regulator